MNPEFWKERWFKNQIGFHAIETNPFLLKYWDELALCSNDRVFVPLCGKTLDISWLLSRGHRVVGIELVELAVEQLFSNMGIRPKILRNIKDTKSSTDMCFSLFSANNLEIWVGDFFALTSELLGPVDAIYDRAALVALPHSMRKRYADHLMQLTCRLDRPEAGPAQLLVTFEYDQTKVDGPPFSVTREELREHYQSRYKMELLDSAPLPGAGLKGLCPAVENVWRLF